MVVSCTGHRPQKLNACYGFDITNSYWTATKNCFKEMLKADNCTKGISGMALGTDMVFALAVLELKQEGYPIELECALPCANQEKPWKDNRTVDTYHSILDKADKVTVLQDHYDKDCLRKRNYYLTDNCDKLYAFWNGEEKTGTGSCVNYARRQEKEIWQLYPNAIEQTVDRDKPQTLQMFEFLNNMSHLSDLTNQMEIEEEVEWNM